MFAARTQQTSHRQPALRLVRDDDFAAVADQGHERRAFARRPVNMAVTGRRLDRSVLARWQPAVALVVRDVSAGGLSAVAETPLTPGERIAVSVPAEGMRMGWGAAGRVLRCDPVAAGYSVAVEFEMEAGPYAA